jgi:hypothetical protein
MDPFIGARHVDGASSAKSSRPPFVAELSGAHTPFIADAMLLVDSNRLVTGFLFPEAVGSTYRGASRMAALGQ